MTEEPTRHAALVGDHTKEEAGRAQALQRLGDAVQPKELVRISQVAELVQKRSVAIQEDGPTRWVHRSSLWGCRRT